MWFSYASDWAWLNSQNENDKDDNWLRASLGWPNYGLATMGGYRWDFSSLGAGAPLAGNDATCTLAGEWELSPVPKHLG